jgi:hypothetical protein
MIPFGYSEVLVLLAIAFVLLRELPRLDLFACAHKYRSVRSRTRPVDLDNTDLIFAAVVVLAVVGNAIIAFAVSVR